MNKTGRYTELIIHAVLWLGLYIIGIAFIRTLGHFSRIDGTLLWPITIGTIINMAIFYLVSLVLIPNYVADKKLGKFLLLLMTVVGGLTLLETLIDYYFLEYVYSSHEETFASQLLINSLVHFVFFSLALGYGFTRSWFVQEQKKQQLSREKLTAEINFLRTQLNPHFLFNVLNMAYSSASQSGDDRTADIIEKLSGMMRYMLYESNVEKVNLEHEISFIRNYIKLHKMRFSDDMPVKVDFQVKGNATPYRIAPLILISFIENAFKHGVKLEQESVIHISMNVHEGEMEFVCTNPVFTVHNGLDRNSSGIGLENTRKRLEIIYPGSHKLRIMEKDRIFKVYLWLKLN